MKLNRKFFGIFGVLILMSLTSQLSFAIGHGEGNGGDICENRIQTIRDDISGWILSGGSQALILSQGVAHESYSSGMLKSIRSATISCSEQPIFVGGVAKTCRNFWDAGVPQIECNFGRFSVTSESDQYVLVHHEYAGLSGLEVNEGPESNYQISNQLSEILESQVVKKLPIRKVPSGRCGFSALAGTYGGNFQPMVGPEGEDGFPVRLTILEADEPGDLTSECPSFRVYYSRPDLQSNAGVIIAAGTFEPATSKLKIFNDGTGDSSGVPGHLYLDMRGIWDSTKIVGKMVWWQSSGTFALAKCARTQVSDTGVCL